MGFFSSVGRNYRNASARVWIFLYVVRSYDERDNWGDPRFNWNCTGLELHKFASAMKKGLLAVLNESAEEYRKTVQLPEDYWRLSVRAIVNNLNASKGDLDPQFYELTRDSLCLIAETFTEEFNDGDSIGIVIAANNDVWVEILNTNRPLDMKRKCLGNVQKSPTRK